MDTSLAEKSIRYRLLLLRMYEGDLSNYVHPLVREEIGRALHLEPCYALATVLPMPEREEIE